MARPSAILDVAPTGPVPEGGGGYSPSTAHLRAFAALGAAPPKRSHQRFEPSISGKPPRKTKRREKWAHPDRDAHHPEDKRGPCAAARPSAVCHAKEPHRNPRERDQQPLPAEWSCLRHLVR